MKALAAGSRGVGSGEGREGRCPSDAEGTRQWRGRSGRSEIGRSDLEIASLGGPENANPCDGDYADKGKRSAARRVVIGNPRPGRRQIRSLRLVLTHSVASREDRVVGVVTSRRGSTRSRSGEKSSPSVGLSRLLSAGATSTLNG
jgi:hypothetical protein